MSKLLECCQLVRCRLDELPQVLAGRMVELLQACGRLFVEEATLVACRPPELGDTGIDDLGHPALGLAQLTLEVRPPRAEREIELAEPCFECSIESGDGLHLALGEVRETCGRQTARFGATGPSALSARGRSRGFDHAGWLLPRRG